VEQSLNGEANVASNGNPKVAAKTPSNGGAAAGANAKANGSAAASVGRLSVKTVPAGAEVRWGERALGTSPVDAEVPVGAAVLKIRAKGFAPVDRALDAAAFAGTPPTVIVNEKLRAIGKGTLTLGAIPWAHVTVDVEKKRDTPIVGLAVTAGTHQVWMQCPATGRELKLTVNVDADAEVKRVVDLTGEPKIVQ